MVFALMEYNQQFGIWASLVAQRLRRLLAMEDAWVQPLGRKDPLEKEMTTHSSVLASGIPQTKEPAGLQVQGVTKSQTQLSN